MKGKLFTMIVVLAVVFMIGCTQPLVVEPSVKLTDSSLETSQELKKFSSVDELKKYLDDNMEGVFDGYAKNVFARSGGIAIDSMDMAVAESAPMEAVAGDYSETNVQVVGVDEADFVKNDGKYIYTLTGDVLVIVDAFPADDAEIVSKTLLDGRPVNMFVNGDRLVVFSVTDDEVFVIPEYDYFPQPRYTQKTHAYVYDISDKEDPELVNDFNVNGNYFQARMIGDYVYFIAKDSVYYFNNLIDVPVLRNFDESIVSPEIFYFDNPEQNFVFHTVAAFDVNDDSLNAETYMMGHSNTLYVSTENIYISYQKNPSHLFYRQKNEDRFYKVVLPLLPSDVQLKIKAVDDWDEISSILEDMYNTMEDKEKSRLIEEIEEKVSEYELKLEIERRKSIIHKIGIDNGRLSYNGKGEVPGRLLNQFSLDEHDGNLRVATTTEIWTRFDTIRHNNVYVLDEDMDTIGELEEIAPGESIFSTRFIGDRLYMVTFERVDPFFVIDLSNPRKPAILGELKIPGFSDYLHPYDEDHIIGIGKETKENQWGGISTKGVKLALFDVSDVSHPKEVDKIEIGTSGSDSEALNEHKAFLFDKKKNLLVIPLREVKGEREYDRLTGYRQRVWQGAYVFSLTPEDGFDVKGKISHNEGFEEDRWYWGSPYAVKRSLYMDDVLYTISHKKIMMHDLEDIDEINEVDLPYKRDKYYPVW
ncbi:copper amine oxidase [Candidatus Woesearchaeota archaeon]|nr:copper amine oxidase [Candidatus Woesearchaeota archaeon]